MQLVLQVQESGALLLGQAVQRHVGPLGDHGRHVFRRHDRLAGLLPAVSAGGGGLLLLPEAELFVAAPAGGFDVADAKGFRETLVRAADLLLDLADGILVILQTSQAHGRTGLVDHVDGLVRQVPVVDIAGGQLHGRFQRFRADGDAVVLLVAVRDAPEDLQSFRVGGFLHLHLLEAPLQRGILLHIFAVLAEGGRADQADLASRERRLQNVRRVDGAFRAARSDQSVHLIDEEDHIAGRDHFRDDALDALLELAAVLGPGHDAGEVQCQEAAVLEGLRDGPAHDLLGEALHDGRLADAGLADEAGIVLGAPAEDAGDPADLVLPADHRIEPALGRKHGQVAAVLGQEVLLRVGLLQVVLVGGRVLADRRQDLIIDLRGMDAHRLDQLAGHAAALRDDREQQVLRADLLGVIALRLCGGDVHDLLAPRGEAFVIEQRKVAGLDRQLPDHIRQPSHGDVVVQQDLRGDAAPLFDQSLQEMLRSRVVLPVLSGCRFCECDRVFRDLGVFLLHIDLCLFCGFTPVPVRRQPCAARPVPLRTRRRSGPPSRAGPLCPGSCISLPRAGSGAPSRSGGSPPRGPSPR